MYCNPYCNPFVPRAYPRGVLRALTDVPGFRRLPHKGRSVAPSAPSLALIHRSAWRGYSPKLNFRFTEFSEVHTIPVASPRESSESPSIVGLFGARRLSQQSHLFSPEPRKRCLPKLLSFSSSREALGEVLPIERQQSQEPSVFWAIRRCSRNGVHLRSAGARR